MFTRLRRNVRTYPKTAAVLGCIYLGAAIGSVVVGKLLGITTTRQILIVGAVLFVAAFDGLTYIWFMGNCYRVAALLGILNTFEGRKPFDESAYNVDLFGDERGQDVAEYAVLLAVILVIALATIHLVGSQANNVFSQIGSKIQ